MRRRRSESPSKQSFKKKRQTRGRARSGLTPERSPEPQAFPVDQNLTVEDIERDKELVQEISTKFHERAFELFETPDTVTRIRETIKKSYLDAMKSTEFRRELLQLIQKEQDKLKQSVLLATRDSRDVLIKAEMDYRDIQALVAKQEAIIKKKEQTIADCQRDLNRLRGVKNPEDEAEIKRWEEEKEKEEKRKKFEEDEARRKKEEERLIELKKKREQEEADAEEKKLILSSKRNSRQIVSFSMFGGI